MKLLAHLSSGYLAMNLKVRPTAPLGCSEGGCQFPFAFDVGEVIIGEILAGSMCSLVWFFDVSHGVVQHDLLLP